VALSGFGMARVRGHDSGRPVSETGGTALTPERPGPDDSMSTLDTTSTDAPNADDQRHGVMLRTRIVDAVIEIIRTTGNLTPDSASVAEVAGVDADLVQQYFPTFESLAAVVINRWHEGRLGPLLPIAHSQGAAAFLGRLIEINVADPRMMRLLISSLILGSDRTNPAASFYRHQYDSFYRTLRDLIVRDVEAGREPAGTDPGRAAEQLLALYEGLQIQAMLRDGLVVGAAFDKAAARLRAGWAAGEHGARSDVAETFSGVYDI
jgi:AcrR family transcriptional regulator